VYKWKGSVLLFLLLEKHFVKIVKWGMSLVKRKKWKLSQKYEKIDEITFRYFSICKYFQ